MYPIQALSAWNKKDGVQRSVVRFNKTIVYNFIVVNRKELSYVKLIFSYSTISSNLLQNINN